MPKVTVNGTEIFYETKGNGEPILFLHGMGGTWLMWEPQLTCFSEAFKMIMVDLRGHGQSGKNFPNNEFSFEVMADDLKFLLDDLGLKKVHVVGVSMGAVVAQIFSYKYPEYVEKLVISDGFSEMPNKTGKFVLALTIFLARLLPTQFIHAATYSLYKGKEKDQVYTRDILKKSTSFTKKAFIEMKRAKFPQMTTKLMEICAPTLVIFGDRKSFGIDEEKAARTIFQNIKNSILVGFHNAFDPVTVMRKDEFNEIVFQFFHDLKLPELDGVYYEYKEENNIEVTKLTLE